MTMSVTVSMTMPVTMTMTLPVTVRLFVSFSTSSVFLNLLSP